jgi:hypothetical protein
MLGILGTLALTLMLGTILLYLFHYVVQTDDVSLQMLASSGSSSSLGVGIGLPTFPKITREDSTTTSTLLLSKEALDMCTKTLWHTLETTTIVLPGQETFVHTVRATLMICGCEIRPRKCILCWCRYSQMGLPSYNRTLNWIG